MNSLKIEKRPRSGRKVLVSSTALNSLLAWANDAIDFDDETDAKAVRAFQVLSRESRAGATTIGCVHGVERGFLCHECGKIV